MPTRGRQKVSTEGRQILYKKETGCSTEGDWVSNGGRQEVYKRETERVYQRETEGVPVGDRGCLPEGRRVYNRG